MWPHGRSKKPITLDADPRADQKYRPRNSRLRGILGLSRGHKHVEPEVQETQLAQRNFPQPVEIVATEIAHQPKQGHSGLGHEPSAEPVMPITALPISKTDEDAVNVGDRFPRDLWQEAAGSLDKKQRILLGLLELSNHNGKSSPQSAVGAIEEVVQKTESSLAAYKNSRKIKRQDGKVLLDVRGNAESILRGTLRVKAIIDAGVKFDPTGYASAAWGIISLGLQLAQNDIDRTNDVFNASAFLTDVLRRYTNIEANYRDQTVPDVEHLEDRIVAVYKSVLEFSANVREHHKMGAGSRILETFYSLDKPALQELKSSVNEADSAMENWRQLIEHEYRIKESAKIEERVNKVLESTKDASAKLSILMTNAEKGEFNDILNWLQTMSTASKHNTNIRIRNPDTAEWIFTNEEYLSWLRGEKLSNRLLWLHGPYGSGKSVLLDKAQLRVQHSANVIHRLLQEQDSYTTCAYWYFDSGISANDTNAALRSVIAQIVGALQIMPNDLRILKAENAVPNREPTREDLLKVFVAAIEEFQSRSDIIIAFDALDECPDRADFLGAITSIMESTRGVRILLTGRPEQDIHSRIVPIATDLVPILNTAGDDVERFVAKELEDETFVRYGKEVQDAVKRKLLGNDDKRFRLASMQIQELKNCWDTSLMYETLDEIPTSIEQAYQNALIKISEKRRKAEKIAAVFEWIYVARRKLTLGELGSALRVEFPEVLLSDCPTCLIRMSDERHEGVTAFTQSWKARTVEFDHSSVRDFLISTRLKVTTDPKLSLYYIDLEKSNVNAAITCLDILLAQCDVNSLDLAVKKQPMLNYAATYWVSHVSPTKSIFNEVSGPLQNPEITRKVLQLFSEGDLVSFLNWLRVYDPDKPTQTNDFLRPLEECAQPLYYAAILGLEKIVEILLSRGAQIKSDKGSFEDAFVAAALQGQVGCLEKMLEAGYALKSLNLYHIIREVKTNAAEVMDVVLGAYLADSTAKARADMAYITDQVVKASVQNSRNATVLINSCAKHNLPIRITRDIALVAKTYYRKVKDAIIFLLRRHQDQHLIIHEDVLIATALKLDGDIMKMALDCTSETAPFSTSTVESLVLAAARITQRNRGAIIALLDRVGDQFRLTETIVNAIASSSWVTKEWIDFLVHRFKSEIPITNQLVLAAARYCDGDVMDILLSRGEYVPIDNNIVVAVSQNGDYGLDVIRVLLNRKTEEFQITQELIWTWVAFPRQSIPLIGLLVNIPGTKDLEISKYTVDRALKNNENGVTILKILLQKGHRGTSSDAALEKVMRHFDTDVIDLILDRERQGLISLSEKAIQAAIYNKDYGREIMGLLLDHLGETFPVTEDVVSTVVKELDAEAMKLFLDHHGSKVPVTPRVISCVGENEHNGAQIFQILLKYKEADFDISNELIQASASSKHNAKAMTTHFLSHRGVATLEIDQESAVAVATALDGETMTLLLDLWVESTQLGEPVLYGAVRNEKHGTEIVDILLERYRQCSLTLNVVKAAVNNRLCGRDILSSLLDYDKDLPLSEGAIEIAVANSGVGCEIVSLLLERRPQDFPVTDNILKAIIRNKNCGAEMMSALMSKHGNDIAVTPELLAYAAAWNSVDDAKMVGLLLDLQKAPNLVTEDVLFAAVCCRFDCSPAVLAALLGRQPLDKIPLTATIMANMSPGPLAAFLRHLPKDYIITESMVKAVVLKESSKGQKTSLLLDYRGKDIAITKGLIEAALKSYRGEKVIRLLLYRRGEDFPITKEIVTAIARNYDEDIMTLLLEQRREEVSITSAMLEAAACNYSHGPEMLEVLLSWSPETPVTEKLMIMAGRSDSGPRSMKLIMDKYGKKAPITDEVLKAIIGADRSGKATMEVLFERRGQDIVLTEGVVKHAFLSHGSQRHEVLNALLRGPGQQSKAQITEEAMIALARYFGLEVMTLCLDACGTNVATTAKMIEAAAQNSKYGQDIIKILRSLPSSDFAIGSDAIS